MSNNDDDGFKFPDPSGIPDGMFPPPIRPAQNPIYVEESGASPALEAAASTELNAAIESSALEPNSMIGGPSLCDTCIHCWSMRKTAEVKNLDVNGKPFLAREDLCAVMPQALFTLNDRSIRECNKYQSGGKPRTRLEDK